MFSIKKILLSTSLVSLIIFTNSCKEKEFIPPNTQNTKMGNSERIIPSGTAKQLLKYADKMAHIWDKSPLLMSVNGDKIGSDGYNKPSDKASKWIFTYKSNELKKGYSIIFAGDSSTSWLETSSIDTTKAINSFIDSTDAINNAIKEGIKDGEFYTMELYNNDKGLNWVIGSKLKDESKYDVKSVNALDENK